MRISENITYAEAFKSQTAVRKKIKNGIRLSLKNENE